MKTEHPIRVVVSVSILVYLAALGLAWTICTRQAERSTERLLVQSETVYAAGISDSVDCALLLAGRQLLSTMDRRTCALAPKRMEALAETFQVNEINIIDTNGLCIASNVSSVRGADFRSSPLTAAFLAVTNPGVRFVSQPFRNGVRNPTDCRKYLSLRIPDGNGVIQLGYDFNRIASAIDLYSSDTLRAWKIGRNGHFDTVGADAREHGLRHPDDLKDGEVRTGRENGETVFLRAFTFAGHRFLAVVPMREYFDGRDTSFAILAPVLAGIVLLLLIFVRSLQRAREADARRHAAEEEARARDLALAREIQRSCLPMADPVRRHVPSLDFEAVARPAREIGGDFYDFCLLDLTHLAFVLADVSGKGIPAALFMMNAKNELFNALHGERDLAAAVRTANARLCEQNEAQMFVTAWAGVIDTATGVVTYVNAGHNRPFVRRADGATERIDGAGGLFLGMFPEADYVQNTLTLAPGDALFLFTDGVTEAMNGDRALYGEERLRPCLSAATPAATALIAAVEDDVRAFAAGAEQSDDLTVLALVRVAN